MLSLPAKLNRYASVAALLLKHRAAAEDARAGDAEQLARQLESLGPTFIKLGQLLSTRADLLPPAYVEALTRLQDNVAPSHSPTSSASSRRSSACDCRRASECSKRRRSRPRRSARSIARRCATAGWSRSKVQRPDIDKRVAEDMETLGELAAFLDKHGGMEDHVDFSEMMAE